MDGINVIGEMERYSRRRFLKQSAFWAGGAWVIGIPLPNSRPYSVLTEKEAEIMDQIADTIIPPDKEFIGGKEAMTTRFIDRQLDRYGHLRRERARYQTSLPALQRGSVSRYGHLFTELDEESKALYLREVESGLYDNGSRERGWDEELPSAFFRLVRDHCMMGFYGSPQHGGNKEFVSFRMLGLI